MATRQTYKNLVLGGGSIRGISHIGALQRMCDAGLVHLPDIQQVSGSSVGSIIGLYVVLGFTAAEMWQMLLEMDTGALVNPNLTQALDKLGLDDGKIIYNYAEGLITNKFGTKHMNFKQLHDQTGITFSVVGTCLTTKKAVYFNHINTPCMKVSMAIRISISMPGYFSPIDIDGNKYIDGCIFDDFPMHLHENLQQTLGILLCKDYKTTYDCPEEYMTAIFNIFMYRMYNEDLNKYPDNTIYVYESKNPLNILNFKLDVATKRYLYDCGCVAAQVFIDKLSNIDV